MKKIKSYQQFIKESNSYFEYNNIIDYTLLEDNSTDEDIKDLCEKAKELGVKSVCVLPKFVKLASKSLEGSEVLVCTVVSFPGGDDTLSSKMSETKKVISDGADEVDMVLDYNLLKLEGENAKQTLIKEVSSLVDICHQSGVILKVIVESGLLDLEQTKIATDVCLAAGADFIKTSTGKVSVGAEMDKIKVMFDTIKEAGSDMKIKASGGIRTVDQINGMIGMVDRFGMGYGSVDQINGIVSNKESNY